MNIASHEATNRPFIWLIRSATAFAACILAGPAVLPDSPSSGLPAPRPIKISSLPKPPDDIAIQLREGKVQLTTGELPADHVANRSGLDAETDYEINFSYRCRPQWQKDTASGTVRIRANFTRIQWEPTHKIWFRNPPPAERFWIDALVQHEFDHVRLSADARMKKRFVELLRSKQVFTAAVAANQTVNRALIDRLIGEHVTEVFQEVKALIDIRYRELDRVTRHGRQAVPKESTIHRWLNPEK